jgi:D-alanine-D-alanine ligase
MIRQLPADISADQTARVQDIARRAYRSLDCAGVARVDTLLTQSGEIFLNEINTVPGSLSSYLWEASGIPFPRFLDRLIELAFERARQKRRTRFSAAQS